MKFSFNAKKLAKWLLVILVVIVLLYAIGRPAQIYWQSRITGVAGPYLQLPGSTITEVRWQTAEPEQSSIRWSRKTDIWENQWQSEVATTVHRVLLQNLQANSRYYYQIGSNDTTYHFITAPAANSLQPVRMWIQGDPGRARKEALQTSEAAMQWMQQHPYLTDSDKLFDLWLTTGDNAYKSGKNSEFQRHLFIPYADLLPYVGFIPVYGNHDARRWSFFRLFSFPVNGELGGYPSKTQNYYSLNYGMAHIVILDSQESDLAADGAMVEWLQSDLAQNQQRWTIVLFHHPPYTKGSHDSDSSYDSGGRMIAIRQNILPVLEQYDVDMIFSGHSHVYERSHLMRCHYGDSTTFRADMWLDRKSPYNKSNENPGGSIYLVVGASSNQDTGPVDHPAHAIGLLKRGSLVLDISDQQIQANYIGTTGEVLDSLVLTKQADYRLRKDLRCD